MAAHPRADGGSRSDDGVGGSVRGRRDRTMPAPTSTTVPTSPMASRMPSTESHHWGSTRTAVLPRRSTRTRTIARHNRSSVSTSTSEPAGRLLWMDTRYSVAVTSP